MTVSPSLHVRPHSRWLRLARAGLIGLAMWLLVMSIGGVILFPDYAQRHYRDLTPNDFWTVGQAQAALAELGWPATTIAWYLLINDIIGTLIGGLFVVFLFWRKSDNWFGLYLVLAFLSVSPGSIILLEPIVERFPVLIGPVDLAGAIGWQLIFILFYVFPDGRFVPRWARWMPLVWLAANLTSQFSSLWVGMALIATAVGSQVYRYGWRSTPSQRQQTKWVVAVLIVMIPFLLGLGPRIFTPPPENALGRTLLWALVGGTLFRGMFLLIPAAILVAILRYRLWDIDLVIRRTLSYSALTAILALVYFGGVVLLQSLFTAVGGQSSPAAVVISTLAGAALFTPLRRWIQRTIDGRFYRRKYDAERTLASYASTARDEVDAERLAQALLGVVDETIQPTHASVWLREG